MKSFTLLGLALTFVTSLAFAEGLDQACQSKVISAVNKQHTLAEGASYALRILHKGDFASALLVGHSDETDPTDYLVLVDHYMSCKVKSIVYASEASSVVDYSDAEMKVVSDIYALQEKELIAKALELFKKVPESGYDARTLCIKGDKVVAVVPMTHWSSNDRKTATGSLSLFPQKITDGKAPIKITGSKKTLVEGTDFAGIYKIRGEISGAVADICLVEDKALLESVSIQN